VTPRGSRSGSVAGGQDRGEHRQQLVAVHRLRHVRPVSREERLRPVFRPRVGSQRDGRNVPAVLRRERPHPPDQGQTVVAGHAQVGEEQVGRAPAQQRQRLLDVAGELDLEAAFLEHRPHQVPRVRLVVDDQEPAADELRRTPGGGGALRLQRRSDGVGTAPRRRQVQSEPRTAIRTGAVGGDPPAVQLDDLLDDIQPDAHAADML